MLHPSHSPSAFSSVSAFTSGNMSVAAWTSTSVFSLAGEWLLSRAPFLLAFHDVLLSVLLSNFACLSPSASNSA